MYDICKYTRITHFKKNNKNLSKPPYCPIGGCKEGRKKIDFLGDMSNQGGGLTGGPGQTSPLIVKRQTSNVPHVKKFDFFQTKSKKY